MLLNGHDFTGFRLLKEVNNPIYLNAYENLYIYKTKHNNMNIQTAQVESALYKFCPQMTFLTVNHKRIYSSTVIIDFVVTKFQTFFEFLFSSHLKSFLYIVQLFNSPDDENTVLENVCEIIRFRIIPE